MIEGADLELFERSLRASTERHTGEALDADLAELGWRDALADDPRAAVSILFELQGFANATSSALLTVVLDALDLPAGHGILLPAAGDWCPPATGDRSAAVIDGLTLRNNDDFLVTWADGDAVVATIVPAAAIELERARGIDSALALLRARGTADLSRGHQVDWTGAVAAGQRALAHELIGASRRMLDLARAHALERVQFGRAIAMFQAIRHRLAATLVAIEMADAMLAVAWDDAAPESAAMAKAVAGRAARTTARHCQQVLAGIGFTTEHPLHLYIRRALVLDQLLGSSKRLTADLGSRVVSSGELPDLLPL
jgi:hypothetical protein